MVVDELGVGFKAGMKNKYQRAFNERLVGIAEAVMGNEPDG
jgi:hypothetical protein